MRPKTLSGCCADPAKTIISGETPMVNGGRTYAFGWGPCRHKSRQRKVCSFVKIIVLLDSIFASFYRVDDGSQRAGMFVLTTVKAGV